MIIYDPKQGRHDYLTRMYFNPLMAFMVNNRIKCLYTESLKECHGTVLVNADHLTPETVATLKNNNCKIIGFSVTDSSYVSQACRSGKDLQNIDLMFMLTGVQRINEGREMIVNPDLSIGLEPRQFLPDEDWLVFDSMRQTGRLKSLPYVHWERLPEVEARQYNQRSQKVIIRGGHHMRRFILALHLMQHDLLDINSGFVTSPYFQDDMNPQFRYCDDCRATFKKNHGFPVGNHKFSGCTNEDFRKEPPDLSDLGRWNNKCPLSFYGAATLLSEHIKYPDNGQLEKLMNARWLPAIDHQRMLARITFTSDLKWLFSIYAAQRFWDAAAVGCVNLLPSRTADQDYFPAMNAGEHYFVFHESLSVIQHDSIINEPDYGEISKSAKNLYREWIKSSTYATNTNLLQHISDSILAIQ